MFCDLHMHSTASDGTNTPAELATLAKAAGLGAIALTDHDTTAGLPECESACKKAGVAFAPGIELSAEAAAVRATPPQGDQRLGTLHILGLFVRHDDPKLLDIHHRLLQARQDRNPQIVRNLQDLGVRIDYVEVVELASSTGTAVVGRPHIAQVLVKKGYVKSVQDAFSRYIGEGKAAYVRKDTLDPRDAIEAIHAAGGLAILAHPIQLRYRDDDELSYMLTKLKDAGLDGVEVRHSDHTAALADQYQKLAEKLGLLVSGGSDYHGSRKAIEFGSQRVGARGVTAIKTPPRRGVPRRPGLLRYPLLKLGTPTKSSTFNMKSEKFRSTSRISDDTTLPVANTTPWPGRCQMSISLHISPGNQLLL
jgi:3',5'-nucleoside bisphosphate phosphatase